jgi:hypothetical protein
LSPPAMSGSHLYIGSGVTIDVFDIADPSNPVLVDRMRDAPTPKPIRGIVVVGDTIYVAWGEGGDVLGGVSIYSIADPAHPVWVAELDGYPGDSVITSDSYVYLVSGQAGTVVLDAHDPLDPVVIGGSSPLKLPVINELAVVGHRLFMAGSDFLSDRVIAAYDISDPAHMKKLGYFSEDGMFVRKITIQGDYAIGVGANLQVLDLHDPANIVEVFSIAIAEAETALVDNDVLYVFGDASLQVWDYTTPSRPSRLGAAAIDASFTDQVALTSSGPLDLTDRDLGFLIDDTTPQTPTTRSFLPIPGGVAPQAAVIDGRRAFVAEQAYGFQVLDLDSFESVGRFEITHPQGRVDAIDLAQQGTRIFMVSDFDLFIADVSDPTHPSELGRYAMTAPNCIVVDGDRAYVTSEFGGGLTILDVSDPAHVQTIGSLDGPLGTVYPRDLVVRGSTAFMATEGDLYGDAGLRIADLSDQSAPQLVGTYSGCGSLWGNAVDANSDGTVTYLGCADGTLQILDTHDVTNPTLIGTYTLPDTLNSSLSLGLRDGRAYLGHSFGIDEIDVEDPTSPAFISRLSTNWQVNRVVLPAQGPLLAVTGAAGIYRFDEDTIFRNGFE